MERKYLIACLLGVKGPDNESRNIETLCLGNTVVDEIGQKD